LRGFADTDRLTGDIIHPFDNVIRHQDLAADGLAVAVAGDVFVTVLPGYSLVDTTSTGPITTAVAAGGTHGHSPLQPELRGVFLAAGPHIQSIAPRATRLIDVAPTMAEALGVPLPGVDGTPLFGSHWQLWLPMVLR
jgi:hypothetical protein